MTIKTIDFQPCWEYFNCPEQSRRNCPAYNMGCSYDEFRDCWFHIQDNCKGGPEEHGPCAHCEWNKKYGIFNDQ